MVILNNTASFYLVTSEGVIELREQISMPLSDEDGIRSGGASVTWTQDMVIERRGKVSFARVHSPKWDDV
jgi:hypothetical protein